MSQIRQPIKTIKYTAQNHEKKVIEFFGDNLVRPNIEKTPEITTVFVCFTNRCGSEFFSSYIASSGYLNKANEIFNFPQIIRMSEKSGFEYFSDYCQDRKTHLQKNNFFFAKVGTHQLFFLARLGLLDSIFSPVKFIHVERSDILAQAVSRIIAEQTGKWVAYEKEQVDNSELKYQPKRIDQVIRSTNVQNMRFNHFFGANGIVKYPVNYEHFLKYTDHVTQDVHEWLGIDTTSLEFGKGKITQKQSNPLKSTWRTRFIQPNKKSPES